MSPPILIVGAGPSGLILALSLTRYGVPVRIIDKAAGPGASSRAITVQARILEFYHQLGIAGEVIDKGMKVMKSHVRQASRKKATLDLGHLGEGVSPYPYVLSFAQDEHERLLVNKLVEEGVQIEWNTELTSYKDNGSRVFVSLVKSGLEEQAEYEYLCGCDGAHSTIRKQSNISFPGGKYDQLFYVADVEAESPFTNNDMNICILNGGFCFILPVRTTGMYRMIGVVPPEIDKDASTIRFDDLLPFINRSINLQIKKVNWFSAYTVHHRVADSFQRNRVFISGDAAHIHSPAGGQGMNTGIGDAINLAWKLASVVQGRASSELLDTYETERITFARLLVATTDKAFKFMVQRNKAGQFIRTFLPHVLAQMFHSDMVRKAIFDILAQIRIQYRSSPLSSGKAGRIKAGDRLPWVPYEHHDNYEALSSRDWQVHVYGNAEERIKNAAEALNLPVHEFPCSEKARKSGLQLDALYLLRPDGYIGLADEGQNLARLKYYLRRFSITSLT
ncbi:FAD-dependent monooxygenase [Alteribacillus sp. HJP-4]|uniref:FAD-dependent monooxygenase n=1 Tax=Alteribacillus sp. HJP-4 TaxID=2775394 RepID=UPI0035CD1960